MGDPLRGLGLLFSGGLDLLGSLLVIFIVALVLVLLVAPFESLQWWAGWVDVGSHPPAPSEVAVAPLLRSPAAPPPDRDCYVVFLPGVGALGTRVDPWEQRLVDVLAGTLGDGAVLTGIFPFTVRAGTLTHRRATAWFWRWLAAVRQRRPSLVARLIDWRNLTQVLVSMDPRYGPIYNLGVAEKLGRALVDHGYSPGRRAPVTLIGYSGAAQVALGATPYLARETGSPVTVISLGGVVGDDPALERIERFYHLWGTRDLEARLAAWAIPARWPISRGSRWNRAIASNRLTAICLGAMGHAGRHGYLDADTFTPDGRSYLDVTASTMLAIIRRTVPGGAGPSQSHDRGIV